MGWSTDLFCTLSFNRKTYNHRYEVESDLDEARAIKRTSKERLRELAFMTEPQKFCHPEETAAEYLSNELYSCFEGLEDALREEFMLECLLDNWDSCHNDKGQAVYGPKEVKWDSAFLRGDFVKTDKDTENI